MAICYLCPQSKFPSIPSITHLILRKRKCSISRIISSFEQQKKSPKKRGLWRDGVREGRKGYFREGLGEVRAWPVWGALKPARLVTQHWPQVERKIFFFFFATALALNTLLLSPFDKKKHSLDFPPLSLSLTETKTRTKQNSSFAHQVSTPHSLKQLLSLSLQSSEAHLLFCTSSRSIC